MPATYVPIDEYLKSELIVTSNSGDTFWINGLIDISYYFEKSRPGHVTLQPSAMSEPPHTPDRLAFVIDILPFQLLEEHFCLWFNEFWVPWLGAIAANGKRLTQVSRMKRVH